MKNTTTEQKSIENTTTEQKSIENTTTEQKSIEKTAMKKITATTLLLFLALFSLTTCLIAQESGQQAGQTGQQARKQGWFVGVSPFSFIGTEIKTSRTTTTVVDTAGAASFEYEATIDSDDSVSMDFCSVVVFSMDFCSVVVFFIVFSMVVFLKIFKL